MAGRCNVFPPHKPKPHQNRESCSSPTRMNDRGQRRARVPQSKQRRNVIQVLQHRGRGRADRWPPWFELSDGRHILTVVHAHITNPQVATGSRSRIAGHVADVQHDISSRGNRGLAPRFASNHGPSTDLEAPVPRLRTADMMRPTASARPPTPTRPTALHGPRSTQVRFAAAASPPFRPASALSQ